MSITGEQAAKLLECTTPGPWKMETVRTSCGTCHRIGPFPRPDYASKPEGWACVYDDYPPGVGSPDLLANARLIAAAPDIARALIASEAARKLAEERLAALIRRAHDAIIRDENDGAVWAQLLADMAREIDNG